ncbi:MAG: DUF305 domain-containing protein [Bacteroides sp.]|nr:DUF305 domain-containing protein [Clostridiales bacterium]MCD8079251.1 DUF305 domain-containing protein [Bacteroides sp.]
MNNIYRLSEPAKAYLTEFCEILDRMIRNMEGANLTESISHNFIVQMIPHHMAAIEMSENILGYTRLPELRRIAENIISGQTKSIEDMMRAKGKCSMYYNTPEDLYLYLRRYERITGVMFSEMENAYADNNISADFMREMIPHHRGAIRLCENALSFEICPELVPIMEAIIKSQSKGIEDMEELLEKIV